MQIVGDAARGLLVLALESPFLVVRTVDPWVRAAEPWGILLAAIALGGSLVAFWIDYADRVDQRTVRGMAAADHARARQERQAGGPGTMVPK